MLTEPGTYVSWLTWRQVGCRRSWNCPPWNQILFRLPPRDLLDVSVWPLQDVRIVLRHCHIFYQLMMASTSWICLPSYIIPMCLCCNSLALSAVIYLLCQRSENRMQSCSIFWRMLWLKKGRFRMVMILKHASRENRECKIHCYRKLQCVPFETHPYC